MNASTVTSAETRARPLGQILLERHLLTEDQLRIGLMEQKRSRQPLGRVLISLGFVTEATLREALSVNLGQETVDLTNIVADARALALIPRDFAKRHKLFPVSLDKRNKQIMVALANPNDLLAVDQLQGLLKGEFDLEIRLAAEAEIARAIDQFYGYELSIDGILHEIETGEIDYTSLQTSGDEYSQPVVRLVDALLADAVQRGASDVHFEPEESFLRIRYRIDGVLRQIRALHKTYWPAMVVRIKVMSGMNIAETRAPQDGRISLQLQGRSVDFRVAAQPTTHGENIVLRVLDRLRGLVSLEELGLMSEQLAILRLMLARPEGIILVTGPTGSGKTTTLYSILSELNQESVNIMTLEDPVEYPLPLVRQTNVSDALKLDFANGIRSMMRQDPDIILVGEVRDQETAEMALRAAMTGHQVYSTLHTNSALGALPRLLDLGLQPDILAGNIIGVIAQRLVRKLCPHCKQPYTASEAEQRLLAVASAEPLPDPLVLHHATGCEECDYLGYSGRRSVMEVLKMNADMDDLIARRASMRELRAAAHATGFRTLAEEALRLVREGVTSLEEAARVVDLTNLH